MNTKFKSIHKDEQKDWKDGYESYLVRMKDKTLPARPFEEWITDFGFAKKGGS